MGELRENDRPLSRRNREASDAAPSGVNRTFVGVRSPSTTTLTGDSDTGADTTTSDTRSSAKRCSSTPRPWVWRSRTDAIVSTGSSSPATRRTARPGARGPPPTDPVARRSYAAASVAIASGARPCATGRRW